MKLHKDFPVSVTKLNQIIADIRLLYPEADAIYVVGTYARVNETASKEKAHDLDILIHFPGTIERRIIERRNDDALWHKWSGYKASPVIDFLMMFGNVEPRYGQHVWRMESGLKTPKVTVWRK